METDGLGVTTYKETWSPRRALKRPPARSILLAAHQQDLIKAHQDTIVALCCIQYPFRGTIVAGDRSGVIKVWRMDISY